jgi:hypothetical protein
MKVDPGLFVSQGQRCRYFLEASPDFGFIQAEGSFSFCITLKAPSSIFQSESRFIQDTARQIVEVPVLVRAAGQPLPIRVCIRARLTTSDLVMEPSSLDFGTCTISECTCVPLKMTNRATIPQTYGIADMPRGVSMLAADQTGILLPQETKTVQVNFIPDFAGLHRFRLTCQTLALRTFKLPCTAKATQLPLSFTHNRVLIAATAIGSSTTISTVLRNTSKSPHQFSLEIPAESNITITPLAGLLQPASTERIQMSFAPEISAIRCEGARSGPDVALETASQDPASSTAVQTEAAVGASGGCAVVGGTRPTDEYVGCPQHRVWHVPCHLWHASATADGQADLISSLHLTIETCRVAPKMEVLSLNFDRKRRRYVHQLPATAVGQSLLISLSLQNLTDEELPLSCNLDPLGPFQLAHAPRALPAHGHRCQRIVFAPREESVYWEVMHLHVPGHSVQVELTGHGVRPKVSIEPGERLDLGDHLAGDTCRQEIKVLNPCPFAVKFACVWQHKCQSNRGPLAALSLSSEGQTLEPHASTTLGLTFRPDWQVRSCCRVKLPSNATIIKRTHVCKMLLPLSTAKSHAGPLL